ALVGSVKELLLASVLGTLFSLLGYFALAGVFYFLWIYTISRGGRWKSPLVEVPFPLFLAGYTVIVLILIVVGIWYRPRESYYFGITSRGRHFDDPFTLRDDIDRMHAALGCLLVIPNFIRLNLVTLKDLITAGGSRLETDVAAGILVMGQRGAMPGHILKAYFHLGEKGVAKSIDTMRQLGWIRVEGHAIRLTRKGNDVLAKAGR
ncbi:MAG: hypothetical protein ACYS47_07700, partial [Planctomycetota bacterium]